MSTDSVMHGDPPANWPAGESWPPPTIEHFRAVLGANASVHARIFAWCDKYGRVVSIRSSTTDLDESDSPTLASRGCVLTEVPIEIREELRQRPQSWGYQKEQGWVSRQSVGFSASQGQAYANGVDYIDILVSGVPESISRVRLERNREELWLPRSQDGLFMLRLRSSNPLRVTVSLVDARLWSTKADQSVQFVPPPEQEIADAE